MDKIEHQERHEILHRCLDELIADFIGANDMKFLSGTTLLELMEWSHKQTQEPEPHGGHRHGDKN